MDPVSADLPKKPLKIFVATLVRKQQEIGARARNVFQGELYIQESLPWGQNKIRILSTTG